MSPSRLSDWGKNPKQGLSAEDLARDLIKKKLLTLWQAKMLLKGATKLGIGSYTLTDRLERNAMGDRFSAVHKQLSRKVTIQYLPAALCKDTDAKKIIHQHGRKLANLDHPNLTHVFDIDEENGRVYLVSESINGYTLAALRESNQLPDHAPKVGNLIHQVLAAATHAHASDVFHGNINESNITITKTGSAKLGSLTRSSVQTALDNAGIGTPDNDLKSISTLGQSLLENCPDDEQRKDLAVIFAAIPTDATTVPDQLDQWLLANNPPEEITSNDLTLEPAVDLPLTTPDYALASAAPTGPPTHMKAKQSAEQQPSDDGNFLARIARKSPVGVLAASALVSLLFIGSTVFAANSMFGDKTDQQVAAATPATQNSRGTNKKSNKSRKSRRNAAKKEAHKVQRPDFSKSNGLLAEPPPSQADQKALDPEENRKAIAAHFSGKTPTAPTEPDTSAVQNTSLARDTADHYKPETASDPIATAPATTPPQDTADKNKAANKKSANKKSAKKDVLKAGENPFTKLPATIDIPLASDPTPFNIGRLVLEKKHLLGVELVSAPVIARKKPVFSIARTAEDRQKWNISWQKKKKTDPIVVAQLTKSPADLSFQWLPAAAENEVCNYLRNCRLKLSTPSNTHWLTLRNPIKIDGFQLTESATSIRKEIEIPWMPSTASITAKSSKWVIRSKTHKDLHPTMEQPEITRKSPAIMFMSNGTAQHLWMQIGVDIRKKLKIEASLLAQPIPESRVVPITEIGQISQMALQMKQFVQQAQVAAQQASAAAAKVEKRKGTDWEKKQQAKDQAEEFAAAAKAFELRARHSEFYAEIAPRLVNKDIPLTVTFSLNDQHRIVLAYTTGNVDLQKKKKNKKKE